MTGNNKLRNWIGFWVFGATLNYGYNFMMAASHDLLKPQDKEANKFCNPLSSGTFLLADTVGGMVGIAAAPFSPVKPHASISLIAVLSITSFVVTAFSYSEATALAGVVVAAFSAGAGEATILNVSLGHEKYVISAYTSGLGAAAILSSGIYLCSMMLFTTQTALLVMVIVPLIMYITYAVVIRSPGNENNPDRVTRGDQETAISPEKAQTKQHSFIEKGIDLLQSAPRILAPIFLTTFLRSFIVQGLLELVHPQDSSSDPDAMLRYLNTLANFGMFISQSSVHFYPIQRLWILPCIQTIILFLVLTQILFLLPSFYIMAFLSLATGLVGGAAVVNTYYRIRLDSSPERQAHHMEAAIFANELASAVAGLATIPSHSFICGIISYIRM